MRIKSYYSQSVEQAMAMARRELGPEAMLMNSRQAPIEARHLGAYEVVFAVDAEPNPGLEQRPPATASEPLTGQFAELRRDLDGIRRSIAQASFSSHAGTPPALSEAYSRLTASDISPDLARDLVQSAAARGAGMQGLSQELASRFKVDPSLGRDSGKTKTVALVGPPGAGKTTTLVKLAINYGLAEQRPTLLLSMDTYRIAAAEQLRSYAAILGVGFKVADTPTALAQAIDEYRSKYLILIDTPGLGRDDMDAGIVNAQFLSSRPDIDVQLVLPASMKASDMARTASGFEMFRPHRLLFTRFDETSSFGPIMSEAARSGKALSYFGTGQKIPEDLEAASHGRLLDLVLGTGRAAVSTAA